MSSVFPTSPGLLDDPAYQPRHVPLAGGFVPEVVAHWGPRSQYRWFRRFQNQIAAQPPSVWGRFYTDSLLHRGVCCNSCMQDQEAGFDEWYEDWCCCRC